MKNREKYPNTDNAVKAYEEHNKHCKCGCSFEKWLDYDPEENLVGLGFAALSLALLSRMAKDERKAEPAGVEKNPEEAGNIECPICHSKHGAFEFDGFIPDFMCPNCGAVIGKRACFDDNEFKAWFNKHTTK